VSWMTSTEYCKIEVHDNGRVMCGLCSWGVHYHTWLISHVTSYRLARVVWLAFCSKHSYLDANVMLDVQPVFIA